MRDAKTSIAELDAMIRSKIPIIAVASPEEVRVCAEIETLAANRRYEVYSWTVSGGVAAVYSPDGTSDSYKNTADPVEALKQVLSHPRTQDGDRQALFVFKDLHPYISGDRWDPVVIRSLRDAAAALISSKQTIILLSPAIQAPADLEKDVQVLDFPLPTFGELDEQLTAFISNLPPGCPSDLNGRRADLVSAMQGLTLNEADAVLSRAVIATRHLADDAIPFVLAAKSEIIKQSGALEYQQKVQFSAIGGLDILVDWCQESAATRSDAARAFGVEPDKGVLIVGVPGCGKSLTAKAVAGDRPLLRLDMGAIFGALIGQSELRIRQALRLAAAIAPCVLWIDEVEKAIGGAGDLDGGTSQRVLGTLLTWMQENESDVFVVATANDAGRMRPELLRRFGEIFFVDLPRPDERAQILSIHLAKRGRSVSDGDLALASEAMEGFTGSEIERAVQAAIRRTFVDGQRKLTVEDLLAAARKMVPLSTTMAGEIAAMREWAKRARPASSKQESGGAGRDQAGGSRSGRLQLAE